RGAGAEIGQVEDGLAVVVAADLAARDVGDADRDLVADVDLAGELEVSAAAGDGERLDVREVLRRGSRELDLDVKEVGVDAGGLADGGRVDAVDGRAQILAVVGDAVGRGVEGRAGAGVDHGVVVVGVLVHAAAGGAAVVEDADGDLLVGAELDAVETDRGAGDRRGHTGDVGEGVHRVDDVGERGARRERELAGALRAADLDDEARVGVGEVDV